MNFQALWNLLKNFLVKLYFKLTEIFSKYFMINFFFQMELYYQLYGPVVGYNIFLCFLLIRPKLKWITYYHPLVY